MQQRKLRESRAPTRIPSAASKRRKRRRILMMALFIAFMTALFFRSDAEPTAVLTSQLV